MKKGLIASYVAGITDTTSGEKYARIIRYFVPEYITSLIIFGMPIFIDSAFIGRLESTPSYAALGVSNNFINFIMKIAEAFSVAAVVNVGYFNGLSSYKQAGRVLRDTFWLTLLAGILVGVAVYAGAHWIYVWLGAAPEIAHFGVPYLRLRALSFIFLFVAYSFLGFLRGIKNTRTTMYIYLIGAAVFIVFDYCLIFGKCGFPRLGLNGSAWASITQYMVMALIAAGFIFFDRRYRQYGISLFTSITEKGYFKEILTVLWPMAIDKATLAMAYLWLGKMINPMGTFVSATFCAVKDLERVAFLPALAFAHVITFLVSNDYGSARWESIKSNIKKVLFLSTIFVGIILLFFSLGGSRWVLRWFDRCGDFTEMTVKIIPLLSILVLFDILQLILSGALRGAGNVRVVMWVRLSIVGCYFIPISYLLSQMHFADPTIKFLCIYSAFYIGNALMSLVYIRRFRGEKWKHQLNN